MVYPWPAQLIYDKVDSRQVQIWRDWCEGKCKRFVTVFPEFFAIRDQCPRSSPAAGTQTYLLSGTFITPLPVTL